MSNSFRSMITGVVVLGLFIFALISFNVNLLATNDANNTLIERDSINNSYSDVSSKLTDFNERVTERKDAFQTETSDTKASFFFLTSIFSVGTTFVGVFVNMFVFVFTLIEIELGVPPIIITAISGILMLTMILYAWRLYKSGE